MAPVPHGLDGFGLLRAIREDSSIASTPVILVSARAGEESRVAGLEADADDYLIKPFAARELLARAEIEREKPGRSILTICSERLRNDPVTVSSALMVSPSGLLSPRAVVSTSIIVGSPERPAGLAGRIVAVAQASSCLSISNHRQALYRAAPGSGTRRFAPVPR
jgi:CheY-like chemotaxis protein